MNIGSFYPFYSYFIVTFLFGVTSHFCEFWLTINSFQYYPKKTKPKLIKLNPRRNILLKKSLVSSDFYFYIIILYVIILIRG